jgi:hypothetical protein
MLRSVQKPGEQGSRNELQSVMSQVFPGRSEVTADWFSGHLIVPDGELAQYTHMGYASLYKKYIVLRVEQGTVTRTSSLDLKAFRKFGEAQFEAFKKTDEYRKALAEAAREGGGMSKQENEEFLRQFYSERYMSLLFE